MVLQKYKIFLTNGRVLEATEPFDLQGPKTLISMYEKTESNTLFCIGDDLTGFHYFKGKDIVEICTAGVEKIDEEDWKCIQFEQRVGTRGRLHREERYNGQDRI